MQKQESEKENGVRRLVWLSRDLDAIVEKTRDKIGLSRSSFIKNAILRYLEDISVISTEAHETEKELLEIKT